MDAAILRELIPELMSFIGRFEDCFVDQRCREHLPRYVLGQLSDLDRKSVNKSAAHHQVDVTPRAPTQLLRQPCLMPLPLFGRPQRNGWLRVYIGIRIVKSDPGFVPAVRPTAPTGARFDSPGRLALGCGSKNT